MISAGESCGGGGKGSSGVVYHASDSTVTCFGTVQLKLTEGS